MVLSSRVQYRTRSFCFLQRPSTNATNLTNVTFFVEIVIDRHRVRVRDVITGKNYTVRTKRSQMTPRPRPPANPGGQIRNPIYGFTVGGWAEINRKFLTYPPSHPCTSPHVCDLRISRPARAEQNTPIPPSPNPDRPGHLPPLHTPKLSSTKLSRPVNSLAVAVAPL